MAVSLDQVAAKGEMDVIDDLAYPLPVTVIAELLGIPTNQVPGYEREEYTHLAVAADVASAGV